ncbi:C-C motif chemokine 19-like [Lepisosteus oculatus]|uniref:C-C motif chemokine 19-like n=1 Tax=Lepisosteus oculatus TaxID=7918 RepID=UPI0007401CF1|nr:PREDICTED: C-C motif chemokine 19-like [Lepisosteus oculatus]XP_015200014.1 PREDICTED: C-C motif chemokine 19-like [Lepisosteus oculatus]
MATLRAALLAGLLLGCARGNDMGSLDCCLSTSSIPIPLSILKDYQVQNPDQGCRIPAVVFITKRDKKLCAPQDLPWVKNIKKWLNHQGKKKSPHWGHH